MKRIFHKILLTVYLVALLLPIHVSAANEFVASKNSDVYHKSSCHYVESILDKNKIWFSSVDAAEKSGRRGCTSCKPQNTKSVSTSTSVSLSSSEKRYSYSDVKKAKEDGFNSGLARGKADGYQTGYDEGYAKGLEDSQIDITNEINTARVTTGSITFIITTAAAYLIYWDSEDRKYSNNIPTVKQVWHKDNCLFVVYQSGNTFKYEKVPSNCYAKICRSSNKSKYVSKKIIGKYKATQINK